MSKQIEYDICEANSRSVLINIVNEWIRCGWHVTGGVMVVSDTAFETMFLQAMVKIEKPETIH